MVRPFEIETLADLIVVPGTTALDNVWTKGIQPNLRPAPIVPTRSVPICHGLDKLAVLFFDKPEHVRKPAIVSYGV